MSPYLWSDILLSKDTCCTVFLVHFPLLAGLPLFQLYNQLMPSGFFFVLFSGPTNTRQVQGFSSSASLNQPSDRQPLLSAYVLWMKKRAETHLFNITQRPDVNKARVDCVIPMLSLTETNWELRVWSFHLAQSERHVWLWLSSVMKFWLRCFAERSSPNWQRRLRGRWNGDVLTMLDGLVCFWCRSACRCHHPRSSPAWLCKQPPSRLLSAVHSAQKADALLANVLLGHWTGSRTRNWLRSECPCVKKMCWHSSSVASFLLLNAWNILGPNPACDGSTWRRRIWFLPETLTSNYRLGSLPCDETSLTARLLDCWLLPGHSGGCLVNPLSLGFHVFRLSVGGSSRLCTPPGACWRHVVICMTSGRRKAS